MNILDELQWRGLIADRTHDTEFDKRLRQEHGKSLNDEIGSRFAARRLDVIQPDFTIRTEHQPPTPLTLYCGFDPTADSLHVGNLVPLLALKRFQCYGHHPIVLAGGATGSIGDPSGKSTERQLLTREVLDANIEKQKEQLRRWLDFDGQTNPARLVDNASWTANVSYLDFLRDIGKHFSVNMMVAKESVRARMDDREAGISYTEFSYMLLQAFDFYILCRDYNCELQIGGSDQWGNITAGTDLIRKKLGRHAFGLTLPLITNADGSKFGKTAAGAIWVDAKRTSITDFFQFWFRTDDRDVIRYLKFFTFLSQQEISALEARHAEKPEAREAHKTLAFEMTRLVHDEAAAKRELDAAQSRIQGTVAVELLPSKERDAGSFEDPGIALIELLEWAGLVSSRSEARRLIQGGGIYCNGQRVGDPQKRVTRADFVQERFAHILLKRGKDFMVIKPV